MNKFDEFYFYLRWPNLFYSTHWEGIWDGLFFAWFTHKILRVEAEN